MRTLPYWACLIIAAPISSQAGIVVQDRLEARIETILAKMDLAEKVGQMTQLTLQAVSATAETATTRHALDVKKLRHAIVDRHVGSLLNVWDAAFSPKHWHEVLSTIQTLATKQTRLGIPILYGIDAIHGASYTRGATLFPQSLNMAATWSPELVQRAAKITAREVRASGIPWTFAPVLGLGRMPLWSRFVETYGEDVLLTRRLGVAAVRGYQGDTIAAADRVACCAKHFLGYSFPLSGKDRTPAWIPERLLREYFLPSFRDAIAAGARTIMVNSGELNGVPVHASRPILTGLLRKELGFRGVVVTDWEDVKKLQSMHRVASSYQHATELAVHAGIDLCMVPMDYAFTDALLELVKLGRISEQRIDASVRRILRLKLELGLFEHPVPAQAQIQDIGKEDGKALSRKAARQSIVLLRNDGVLPLAKATRLLVTGPGANSVPMLHGPWSYTWQGADAALYPNTTVTVLGALVEQFGAHRVTHADGREALDAAKDVDAIVLVLGEQPSVEKPGDIDRLAVPDDQIALATKLQATGKPVILVLLQGRPRIIRSIVEGCAAILHAGYPGPYGGTAVAEILAGAVNPSGRLAFTYPRYGGSFVAYDHKASATSRPQYAFGHGLSYTTFGYSNLRLSSHMLRPQGELSVAVDVANTGERAGGEVVRVFVRDRFASVTPAVRRLRAFQRIHLAPGAKRTVRLTLRPEDLAFVGLDLRQVTEPGSFDVLVGGLEATFRFESDR